MGPNPLSVVLDSYLQSVYGVDPLRALVLGAEEEDVLSLQRGGAGGARPHAEHEVGRRQHQLRLQLRQLLALLLRRAATADTNFLRN